MVLRISASKGDRDRQTDRGSELGKTPSIGLDPLGQPKRDLGIQMKRSHNIYTTTSNTKRGEVTVMIKKSSKIIVKFCNTFESANDGPRAVFIKDKLNDNKTKVLG